MGVEGGPVGAKKKNYCLAIRPHPHAAPSRAGATTKVVARKGYYE
jgi:hypothetical protein